MKITFLGTGTSQGVPVIGCQCDICKSEDIHDKRLRTSILIETEKETICVDAGPDFRQQMLSENVRALDAILITHGHRDHIGGMDDVRSYNFLQKKAMPVWVDKYSTESIKSEFAYAFTENKYPGAPEIDLRLITTEQISIGNTKVTPIELMHLRLPVHGYRIGDFTYITDANFIPEKSWHKIEGSEIIVINALRKEKHISHFNLKEALEIIDRIKPKKAYLTHISHLMGFHEKISKELPENVFLAYDGLKIEL